MLASRARALVPVCALAASACSVKRERVASPDPVAKAIDAAPAPVAKGRVETEHFESGALGVDKEYWIYLPAGYDSSGLRYPVVYLLHGLLGNERNWVQLMHVDEIADRIGLQAIVVMPDGDDSFYADWATEVDYDQCMAGEGLLRPVRRPKTYCVKSPRYARYIAYDLPRHIDRTYRTIASPTARALGGLSMGGYGALAVGLTTGAFNSLASHSGVTTLLYEGPTSRGPGQLAVELGPQLKRFGNLAKYFARVFGTDIENWRRHDPAVLVERRAEWLRTVGSLYLDCGTEDEFSLQHGANFVHEILTRLEVPHAFELLPGRHNPEFWRERIDDSLAFHQRAFSSPATTLGEVDTKVMSLPPTEVCETPLPANRRQVFARRGDTIWLNLRGLTEAFTRTAGGAPAPAATTGRVSESLVSSPEMALAPLKVTFDTTARQRCDPRCELTHDLELMVVAGARSTRLEARGLRCRSNP